MKLFRQPWFIALGFFLLVKPGIVTGIPALYIIDVAIDALRLVLIGFTILCLLFEKYRFNRLFQVVLLLVIFEIWKVVTTLISPQGTFSVGLILNTFGMLLFCFCALKESSAAFIKGGSALFGTYIIINALTVILFPNGIYASTSYTENYFLSYRTAWFPIYLTGIVFVLLTYEYFPKLRNRVWLMVVAGSLFLSLLLVWTVTGLVCFAVGGVVLALSYTRSYRKPINIKWVILAEVTIFLLVVLLDAQEWFSYILVEIFNKDVTLTQRTRIWINAIEAIRSRPLLGHGFLTDEYLKSILNYGATHAHNYYLNNTLHFGAIGTLFNLFIIHWSHKDLSRTKRSARIRAITIAGMAAMLTSFQVEAWMVIGYYLIPLYLLGAQVGMDTVRLDQEYLLKGES